MSAPAARRSMPLVPGHVEQGRSFHVGSGDVSDPDKRRALAERIGVLALEAAQDLLADAFQDGTTELLDFGMVTVTVDARRK